MFQNAALQYLSILIKHHHHHSSHLNSTELDMVSWAHLISSHLTSFQLDWTELDSGPCPVQFRAINIHDVSDETSGVNAS